MTEQLPAGKTQVIELMPHGKWTTGKELLGIICEDIYVTIDPNPQQSEVYKSGWRSGSDMYSLTDVGLRKFLLAGNVKTLSYESRKEGPLIWVALFEGEYMLPNGSPQNLPGEYEFDATEGGPRWLVRKDTEIHSLVTKMEKQKRNVKKLFLKDDEFFDLWMALDDDIKQNITQKAKYAATKFTNQAAQFGRQRAQTGAMDRALRKFFLIRSYTMKELQSSAFHLTRTTVNYELMKTGLGILEAKLLQTADLMLGRGLPEGIVGDVIKLIAEGERDKQIASQPGGFFIDEDDADVVVPPAPADPEQARLYEIPAETETRGGAMQSMLKYYNWEVFNPRKANSQCQGFFNKDFNKLSEAEASLLTTAYTKLTASRDNGTPANELTQQAKHLNDAMARCIVEKRLWRESDLEVTQPELPEMPKPEPEPTND